MAKKIAIIAVVVAILSIGIALALLFAMPKVPPRGPDGTPTGNVTKPIPKEIVSVVSARSAFPFVERWASQYNNEPRALGSVEISYYLDEPDEQGDLMIVGDILDAIDGSQNIPTSAQAVAIVYNIPSFPDIPTGLKLNASLLSGIFNGTITYWDDPAIKELNQDMNLPSEMIVIVHENKNSSSLVLLERYLSTDIVWPENSTSVLGPDELASMIRKTPYSIGYVDLSYATQTRMTYAALAVGGEYVVPSTDSVGNAINEGLQVQNLTGINQTDSIIPPFMNSSRIGNSSYPLVGLYYASIPENNNTSRNATLDFVSWIIDQSKGQRTLSEVQYPSIYADNELLMTYGETIINITSSRGTKD
jgi:ABC-type phosphate transport system substrate-binding protein